MLQVKEIFGPTIQGEGNEAGSPAIFIRFAGCNMWNGQSHTKARSMCPYCDTDFLGGTPMNVDGVLKAVGDLTMGPENARYTHTKFLVVLTGGEPLLQPPADLIELCKRLNLMGHTTQVETNGTVDSEAAAHINHVTVSPKLPYNKLKINWFQVDTLKLLFPHPTVAIKDFLHLVKERYTTGPNHFFIQPIDEGNIPHTAHNTRGAVALLKELGLPWRLSLQTHKILGEQ
jgi:7-carboxy-7-deazaguanine synthase